MPAVTPAAVHTRSLLRTNIGLGSTVTEGNSAASRSANAQCVVTAQPSTRPACAARNAPVQTLTVRRACSAASRSQPMSSGSERASSTPKPPGSTRVSTGRRGSGSGRAASSRPVPVAIGAPPRLTTDTA
jgi:hypothetical protein